MPPSQGNDAESDREAPVLEALRFDPPEVADGGTTTLYIRARDDLSGVNSIYGNLQSPTGSATLPFYAQDPGGGGEFTSRIVIPRQAESGGWFVGSLRVVDRANNTMFAAYTRSNAPQGGVLQVQSQESDSTAPELHRVWVEKRNLGGGERNKITVEVEDDRSGVALVTGAFRSASGSALISFQCNPDARSGVCEYEMLVPANADCGEWTIQGVRAVDKANNVAYFQGDSPQVGRVSFAVEGRDCDSAPPTIETIAFSPQVVSNEAASEILVTMTVHDEGSGVASISGRVEGPRSVEGQPPAIYFSTVRGAEDADAPMTAKFPVPQHTAGGVWKVAWLQVVDKAHNTRTYSGTDPVIADATFLVR